MQPNIFLKDISRFFLYHVLSLFPSPRSTYDIRAPVYHRPHTQHCLAAQMGPCLRGFRQSDTQTNLLSYID